MPRKIDPTAKIKKPKTKTTDPYVAEFVILTIAISSPKSNVKPNEILKHHLTALTTSIIINSRRLF